jgi:hypothetical protein
MAVAGDRLYISTVDGRLLCLSGAAEEPLPEVQDQAERVAWDQEEDVDYLLPPEVPKEGDFDRVTRCKVVQSDLGYRMTARDKGQFAMALNKLDTPLTGTATLKTKLMIPAGGTGMLRNGFLVFGDGPAEEELIKCGIRFQGGRAMIIQGPLEGGKATGTAVQVKDGQVVDVAVTVDLADQQITFTAAGQQVTTSIQQPLQSITHVGFACDSACVDFAPIATNAE